VPQNPLFYLGYRACSRGSVEFVTFFQFFLLIRHFNPHAVWLDTCVLIVTNIIGSRPDQRYARWVDR